MPYNSESSGDYESWWREIKVEHGKIATPWMPHESEVTSQDYPTYIGTYTDETIAGKKTFTEETIFSKVKSSDDAKVSTYNAIEAPTAKVSYMKKNGVVYVTGAGNWGNWGTANVNVKKGTFPTGFRPPVDWHAGMASQGGQSFMTAFITTGGDLMVNSAETGEKYGSFSMCYPAEN